MYFKVIYESLYQCPFQWSSGRSIQRIVGISVPETHRLNSLNIQRQTGN